MCTPKSIYWNCLPPLAAVCSKQAVVLLELVPCAVCGLCVFMRRQILCISSSFHVLFSATTQQIDDTLFGPQSEKTCLWWFAKTKAQTSLRIHAVWSVPLFFIYWNVSYQNLLQAKFQFSKSSLLLSRLFLYYLIGNPKNRFSHVMAHFNLAWGNVKVSMPGNDVTGDCGISWSYSLVWGCLLLFLYYI